MLLGERSVPARNSRYPEIAALLRARILDGEWAPESTLPTLDELAAEYRADKNTISRAISEILEPEGLVWAVPKRGTIVRYGMARPHRMRGNLVKRNVATDGPGYSFPSASGQEVWRHHITPTAKPERLDDARIARLLKVQVGSEILQRHRVTGPEAEPPFQISNSWIHPRVADIPGVAGVVPGPISDWIYRIEKAGHGPLSWMEYHRARLPTRGEAAELQIPATMPVLEIVRIGRSASDGDPVEVTEYVIPSDRVETVHELHRDESAAWPWPEDAEEG
jgi:DNA-binding GntR family transcriptional regulator